MRLWRLLAQKVSATCYVGGLRELGVPVRGERERDVYIYICIFTCMGVLKIRGTILGVSIIRIMVY